MTMTKCQQGAKVSGANPILYALSDVRAPKSSCHSPAKITQSRYNVFVLIQPFVNLCRDNLKVGIYAQDLLNSLRCANQVDESKNERDVSMPSSSQCQNENSTYKIRFCGTPCDISTSMALFADPPVADFMTNKKVRTSTIAIEAFSRAMVWSFAVEFTQIPIRPSTANLVMNCTSNKPSMGSRRRQNLSAMSGGSLA